MSTITLPNIRVSSDLTIRLKLKDGGVAIDWSTLQNIRVSLYADDQRSMASRCNVSIDEEDSTILVCQYAANKMQYLGVNRVIVQCKYMGEVKTYDKPAFTFVRWTSDQEGEQITIDDPDVDVEITVEDVSSSILQEAVDAAFDAADRANDAAAAAEHMVDIHTGPAGKSPYIGENGHWYEWDEETHQYVDTETNAKGDTGETPDISIGTVTTVEPGTPAAASMTGTPEAPVLNLSIPKGLVGATPNFTVGTVTTGEPGSSVIVTITGTPEAPVLNLTIPQGMQGNTGSSVDYPYELVNNLTTNDATKGLSAAQGYVLDGKVSQLEHKVDEKVDINPGINKFDKNDLYAGSFLSDGSLHNSLRHTGKIAVKANTKYCYSIPSGNLQVGARYMVFYKSDGSLCSTPTVIGTNTSSMVFTTPADCAFVALSVTTSDSVAATIELNEGESRHTPFVAFNPIGGYPVEPDAVKEINIGDNSVSSQKIKDGAVTTDKIENVAVSAKKTTFFVPGINLLDKNAEGVVDGYLKSNGTVSDSTTYKTTDYIEIEPETVYSLIVYGNTTLTARWVCFFDSSKAVVGTFLTNVRFITTPQTAKYVRITFHTTYWNQTQERFQVVKSTVQLPFVPFERRLSDEVMLRKTMFFLPNDIYVADGRTIEIYYNQVLLNADQYIIYASCLRGKAMGRKFQFIGSSSVRGDWTLTLRAYDKSENLVAIGMTTIHCVPNTVSATKNVLCVGDSLTNGKFWLQELRVLSSNNIVCVGTRTTHSAGTTDTTIRHEGRSGGDCLFYNNGDGTAIYSYDGYYAGEGKDTAVEFDATASYDVGDYVKVPYTFSTGAGYIYYKYKTAHSPGAFDAAECINLSETNPFWDYVNGGISYNFYKTRNGISPDIIVIWLGTNGIDLAPKTNPDGALGIKTLVDNIRLDDTTTPIVVVSTIFRGTQNGIANQGNTDGYIAQNSYKYNEDKKVLLLGQAIQEMLGGYEKVYICPASVTMDSENDYGVNKAPVNPRLTDTTNVWEILPNEATHPQKVGYEQVADELFSTICYILNQ